MKTSRMGMAVLPCILLVMVHASVAKSSPEEYLTAHNSARAQVRVRQLTWGEEVANYSRNYADQISSTCIFKHSGGVQYGENIALGSDSSLTPTAAVNLWVDEKQNYDYDSNTCAEGKVCGHYTKVVWRNSARLGCARVVCSTGGTFITCNYDPPDNYPGEKPY